MWEEGVREDSPNPDCRRFIWGTAQHNRRGASGMIVSVAAWFVAMRQKSSGTSLADASGFLQWRKDA